MKGFEAPSCITQDVKTCPVTRRTQLHENQLDLFRAHHNAGPAGWKCSALFPIPRCFISHFSHSCYLCVVFPKWSLALSFFFGLCYQNISPKTTGNRESHWDRICTLDFPVIYGQWKKLLEGTGVQGCCQFWGFKVQLAASERGFWIFCNH